MVRINKPDNGQITYKFEELRVIPDHEIFVWGEALIDWSYDRDDPDVGYSGGYDYSVESIVIYYKNKESKGINLGGKYDPLYKWIENALRRSCENSIIEEIQEDHTYIPDEDD